MSIGGAGFFAAGLERGHYCIYIDNYAPVAQLDRASASGAEGHRFNSCLAYYELRDAHCRMYLHQGG